MKAIKIGLWGLLAVLTGFWLMADSLLPEPMTWFSFRTPFVQYTGVLAMGAMSIAMILALRLPLVEQWLNGLDKSYRLHKWLGIAALMAATLHWWWAKGTKWMVGWGWLEKPVRGPRGENQLPALQDWLLSQRGLAETLGEWAFYGAAVLIIVALVKAVPYGFFRKTHTLMAAGYLVLAWHALVLVKFEYWSQPIGWLMLLLIVPGVVSAVLVLARQVGKQRKVKGHLAELHHFADTGMLQGTVALDGYWPGHSAGQFAFVTSNKKEGPHPYTIASAWDAKQKTLTFMAKALGDWTRQLDGYLKPGMQITVEGPYGCFDFEDDKEHQIWIGAGVGITPFIARLQLLAQHPDGRDIDLFYCTSDDDHELMARLQREAEALGMRLHVVVTSRDGRLDADKIRQQVPEWQDCSVWFCGPASFGKALRKDFVAHGLASADIHQELFEMR